MAVITTTHIMEGEGQGPTVGEIRSFLLGVPDSTVVKFIRTSGPEDSKSVPSWKLIVDKLPRPINQVHLRDGK